jgi:tetratricopeptide (TPR) repeat protein
MTVPEAGIPRASVPAIWGDVPMRNNNFTGRDDILAKLRQGASSRITAVLPEQDLDNPQRRAVHGMGGVGKTAIAIEYAHRFKSEYDLVWWIPSDQLPSVRASLAALAARLRLDSSAGTGIDGAIAAVIEALRVGDPYRRWLLVFDNADQPEDIRHLIPDGPGDVLITSRNHRWQSVINAVPMDVFPRQESKEFLLKRVPRGLSDVDAGRLAEELGDLPLALEQAGAMLSETGMLADEYLRLLDEQAVGIMDEGKSPDYPRSMTAAWKLSVSALEQRLPLALALLRCCAFFGPEPIPTNVLRRGAPPPGAPPSGTAVAEVISNPILMAGAIRELARYALVTLDGTSIKVHRLIQALLRDELTDEQRADYRHEAHLILANAARVDPDDSKTWSRFREILPHVNSESTELPRSREPAVRDLARAMMRYLYQSGDYQSALALTERFIEQWTKDSGADSADVLRAQRHLGNILRILGRYQQAYAITEAALGTSRATLGEDDAASLVLRPSFGADLRARGKFREALELDLESRGVFEKNYEADDSRTMRLLSSIALDYGLNSQYLTAMGLYQDAFRRMSTSPWATAIDVLGAWNGVSWTLRLMGQFQEALDVSQDARDYGLDRDNNLGPEHLSTLRTINAYAIVSRRIPAQRPTALEVSTATLDLATRLFGETNPDTLAIAIGVSNLLRTISEDRHPEALALAESTVARYPGVYGPDHPYNYGCQSNLALLKRVTGDPKGARELDEKALEGLAASLGEDHHYTLTVAMNLASDFAVLGKAREARRLGEDTLPRLSALLGENHQHTLACASNLSLDMLASGDEEAGKALQEQVLKALTQAQGREFPDLVVAAAGKRIDPDFDPPPV